MTNHLLLLGAGFSRNWGGPLARDCFGFLVSTPEVMADDALKRILYAYEGSGGFEAALEKVQQDFSGKPNPENTKRLRALEAAINRMFHTFNASCAKLTKFNFSSDRDAQITNYLAKFDAIFTLNQDLLLEIQYANHHNISIASGKKNHHGYQFPGMKRNVNYEPHMMMEWQDLRWTPTGDHTVTDGIQPIFKLHGSTHWHTADGRDMLVMGGAKTGLINQHAVLAWYMSEFERRLRLPDTLLMTIGYGFLDHHINDAIHDAWKVSGLKMFIVDPAGHAVVHPNRHAMIPGPCKMTDIVLVGDSNRVLAETFNDNGAFERAKFDSFLAL